MLLGNLGILPSHAAFPHLIDVTAPTSSAQLSLHKLQPVKTYLCFDSQRLADCRGDLLDCRKHPVASLDWPLCPTRELDAPFSHRS